MGIALLLLGLLPLAFLPDFLNSDEDEDGAPEHDHNGHENHGDLLGPGDDEHVADGPDDEPGDETEPDPLTPNIEDDLPDDGTQNPDPGDVLAPNDEDDVSSPPGADEGDALLPVDQVESDADIIWIAPGSDAGLGYSEIMNFNPGQDVLNVLVDPDTVDGTLDVEVTLSEDGQDALVYVEQQLVAILKNAPDATVADVVVELGIIAA